MLCSTVRVDIAVYSRIGQCILVNRAYVMPAFFLVNTL